MDSQDPLRLVVSAAASRSIFKQCAQIVILVLPGQAPPACQPQRRRLMPSMRLGGATFWNLQPAPPSLRHRHLIARTIVKLI